jgi:hypothetical protein
MVLTARAAPKAVVFVARRLVGAMGFAYAGVYEAVGAPYSPIHHITEQDCEPWRRITG